MKSFYAETTDWHIYSWYWNYYGGPDDNLPFFLGGQYGQDGTKCVVLLSYINHNHRSFFHFWFVMKNVAQFVLPPYLHMFWRSDRPPLPTHEYYFNHLLKMCYVKINRRSICGL